MKNDIWANTAGKKNNVGQVVGLDTDKYIAQTYTRASTNKQTREQRFHAMTAQLDPCLTHTKHLSSLQVQQRIKCSMSSEVSRLKPHWVFKQQAIFNRAKYKQTKKLFRFHY